MTTNNMANLTKELTFQDRFVENDTIIPLEVKSPERIESQLKEIPKEFVGRGEVRGFVFKQIKKTNSYYLFQVQQTGGLTHYEAFRRVENPRFRCVSYPGSKSFGVSAWCCRTLADATAKFKNLLEKQSETNKTKNLNQ